MSLYEFLLFLHIAAAIVWIGSGTLVNVLGSRYNRARDHDGLRRIAADTGELANVLFIPASLATLVLGILTTIEGPWSFDELWILIGLGGIAATIFTGVAIITPRTEEIAALMEGDGMTPAIAAKIKQLLTLSRIDLVVLYLVVADMALKPTGDDVGVLIGMALVVVGAVIFFPLRARAAREPAVKTQVQT
jgi:uncharacterized membrane protein